MNKKTLLAAITASVISGSALAANVTGSNTLSVSFTGTIPAAPAPVASGWKLYEGAEQVSSLKKTLNITRNGANLDVATDAFTITAKVDDSAADTIDNLTLSLSGASVSGLTAEAGAAPVNLTFSLDSTDADMDDIGVDTPVSIISGGATAANFTLGLSGTVEDAQWTDGTDKSLTIAASFVLNTGI